MLWTITIQLVRLIAGENGEHSFVDVDLRTIIRFAERLVQLVGVFSVDQIAHHGHVPRLYMVGQQGQCSLFLYGREPLTSRQHEFRPTKKGDIPELSLRTYLMYAVDRGDMACSFGCLA